MTIKPLKQIRFSTDKRGNQRAQRWDRQCHRYFPISLDVAKFEIATGVAEEQAPNNVWLTQRELKEAARARFAAM